MRIVGIIFPEIGGYSFECFQRGFVIIPVDFVLLQAPPKPFGENIVYSSSFPVHTDTYTIFGQSSGKFLAREM